MNKKLILLFDLWKDWLLFYDFSCQTWLTAIVLYLKEMESEYEPSS